MRIALTGANGKLGAVVLEALLKSGFSVRTVGRTEVGPDFVRSDLLTVAELESAFDGCDWLVHAAGKIEGMDLSANVAMARGVGEAAAKAQIPVLNFSSLSVYGKTSNQVVTEVTPNLPVTAYGKSKLAAEVALEESGCEVCHLRIGNVYSEESFDELAADRLRGVLKSAEISNLVFAADIADIAEFIIGLGGRDRAGGRIPRHLNVVRPDPGYLTLADAFVRTNLRARRGLKVPVAVPHLIRRLTGVPSLPANRRFESEALTALGFRFRPLEEVAPTKWELRRPQGLADMAILHATDSIDRSAGGGTATRTLDIAEQLAARGASCSIVSMRPNQKGSTRSLNEGVFHTVLPTLSRRFYVPVVSRKELRSLVREHDVVHLMGHWSLLNILIARIAERVGVPYVVCPAGSLSLWGRSKYLKRLFDFSLGNKFIGRASGWIAVVDEEVRDFEAHGIARERVTVIPNGATLDSRIPSEAEVKATMSHFDLEREYILFLGRLNPIKGPDLLLEGFLEVADRVGFDLVIAGPDNGLLDELQLTAEQSQYADRIHFLGFVDGADKENLVAGCRTLVIPSRKEAMSVVVLEAAAVNRPVIATTECGLNQLLENGGGWLVDPSVDSIGKALIASDQEDIASKGLDLREQVKNLYAWDSIAETYYALYSGCL